MKKIIVICVLLCSLRSSFACDICGCSSGSIFIGPYPYFHKHFIGTRYSYRKYTSRIADDPSEFSKDFYQTVELWGGVSIGKRWQIMGLIPYAINKQNSDEGTATTSAIGDVTLLANYNVITGNKHQLWLGGGFKLPTGKFDPDFTGDPVPSANVQPGTGSVDVILNATDVLQLDRWSLHSNINYKINGEKKSFDFGNRLNISALAAKQMILNKISLSPYAGLQYEQVSGNKLLGEKIEGTGGQGLFTTTGLDAQFGKINIGANIQFPVSQNFSNHQTEAKSRAMIQFSILL